MSCAHTLSNDPQKDRLWVTYKTRIVAEARYRFYDLASHLLISYLSLVIILNSIWSSEVRAVFPKFDLFNISTTIVLFAIGLIVWGFRFTERASQFRQCYLKLQELHNTYERPEDPVKEYFSILSHYPNHTNLDYEDFLLKQASGIKIGDQEVKATWRMKAKKFVRQVGMLVFFGCAVLLPPAPLVFASLQ